MRRAAKQYARRLGQHLQRAYGASEHYSAPQIRVAVGKLGLDAKYIAFGYAPFLVEDQYASLVAEAAAIFIPYGEARELFMRFRRRNVGGASDFYESGIGMTGYVP
ncbi:MAG TPA: DUF6559 family protein [Stellaceae bacterium]|jgi:hypothetical protein|nr:DUF6559 family protein [Stellaceae bacterium]